MIEPIYYYNSTELTPPTRRELIRSLQREYYEQLDKRDYCVQCPVCRIDINALEEEHRREIERYQGALKLIAGQKHSKFYDNDGESSIYLDADEKMRKIAREALRNEK